MIRLFIATVALGASCIGFAADTAYPSRPVRIVVNLTPGGGVDTVARIAAAHYNSVWNQSFIVDNRPGAGGTIGNELVAKAAPDGYTLLVTSSTIVTTSAVQPQRYDPIRDFQAVMAMTSAPYLVLTAPSLPVSSVKDLLALARAKPGTVTFGSSGTGAILHLGAELLGMMSNTKMLHVPFKGVGEAYPSIMSGDVNWILGFPISAVPIVKAGKLKALAVTSAKRSKLLPEYPTVAESGVTGYEVIGWFGMLAPARVPADIIVKLNAEAKRAFEAPEIVQRMTREGAEIVANSPQEFNKAIRAEYVKWSELVKRQGIKVQ